MVSSKKAPGPAAEDTVERRVVDALDRLSAEELAAKGFDAEKVERIRAAIRAGIFKVDPESVADAVLREALTKLRR